MEKNQHHKWHRQPWGEVVSVFFRMVREAFVDKVLTLVVGMLLRLSGNVKASCPIGSICVYSLIAWRQSQNVWALPRGLCLGED